MTTVEKIESSLLHSLQELGRNLRLARQRRRISRTAFANVIGVSASTLKRMEAGDPSVAIGGYLSAMNQVEPQIDARVAALVAPENDVGAKIRGLPIRTPRGRRPMPASWGLPEVHH